MEPDVPGGEDPLATGVGVIEARHIVDRYVALIGGEEALDACTEYVATGTMRLPGQGLTGELTMYAKAPDKMLIDVDLPQLGRTSSGYDGETGWMIQPMMGPMVLEGEALEQLRVQSRQDEALKRHDGIVALERVGEREIDGVAAVGVKVRYRGGFETTEYYDPDTGWILGVAGQQETPMGKLNVFTRILEHGSCGPVRVPTVTSQRIMGMEQVVDIEECVCRSVPDSIFALPPAIQTLKSNR